ncbi:MAG: hypothetical protein OXG88_09310 [Gammaproteobacteria bacterium]|nr:hypothetical protein [Gammaproteobacteria bacterium]
MRPEIIGGLLIFVFAGCDSSGSIPEDELPDLAGGYTGSVHYSYPPLPEKYVER